MDETERRLDFLFYHWKMIPSDHKRLFFNITRSYPTPPIYVFLNNLGILDTNIERWSTVKREGCHGDQAERTGIFIILLDRAG